MDYRLGDKYIKLSQYDRSVTKRIQDKFNRSKYLAAKELTAIYFNDIVKKVNLFQPKIIRGYPDQMYFLAKYIGINENGVYIAIIVAESVMTIIAMWLFKKGNWKLKEI